MKQILAYLSRYYRAYFHGGFFTTWILFLGISWGLRYAWGWRPGTDTVPFQHVEGIIFYFIPYGITFLLYFVWMAPEKVELFRKKDFWWLSLLICLALYLNQYGLFYQSIWPESDSAYPYFARKLAYNLHATFFYLAIPLIYALGHREWLNKDFHGLNTEHFQMKPYLWMLLAMLPLLVFASFQADFLNAYPRYNPFRYTASGGWDTWLRVLVYELSYALQFVALELFFRGFIVQALGKYIGGASVYPMVALYVFLHFNKPGLEALGSLGGGFILGVIAYYSRSVWGGIWVHIGIAWSMELFAFLQIGFRGGS